MEKMAGKIALVTGGGSGIGRATALMFTREQAHVVVADINVEDGQETTHMINEKGGEATFIKTDVSKAGDAEKLINRTVEVYGRLDCAFNNAGIDSKHAFIAESTEENWDRVMNINLKGVWLCMKYELNQMAKQGCGVIVNMSSISGLIGFTHISAYVASKHGVLGLTKSAALEYAKAGIRVNAICPGPIRTDMMEQAIGGDPRKESHINRMSPMERMGTAEEAAEAVLWLSSDAASFVNGHSLIVDGGHLVR